MDALSTSLRTRRAIAELVFAKYDLEDAPELYAACCQVLAQLQPLHNELVALAAVDATRENT